MSLVEALLRVQAASQSARRQIGETTGILSVPGAAALLMQIENLETQYAQAVARQLGATPMAMGGLVTEPTFALLGEAGPEMVTPVPKKKRKSSKYEKTLGRELAIVDSRARKKDGSYRSGWNRSKVLTEAHRLTRKVLGMRKRRK